MAEGVQVRNIEDLRQNFDVEKVISYFLDGKLQTWLEARYYEDEAEAVAALSKDDANLGKALSGIFGVEYAGDEADIEEIEWKNARVAKIKQLTDDDEIIRNADLVAFNQEELAALYDEGAEKIYLCEGEFTIPKSKQDLEYIEFGGATVKNRKPKQEAKKQSMTNVEFELRRKDSDYPMFAWQSHDGELYIKGTDDRISDENERVQGFEKISNDTVAYLVYDSHEDEDGDDIYEYIIYIKTIGGDKRKIYSDDDEDIEKAKLIHADEEKVVWTANNDSDVYCFSYYTGSGKIKEFLDVDADGDMTEIAVYKDLFWYSCSDDDGEYHLCACNMKTGKDVFDKVHYHSYYSILSRFVEGKIYYITEDEYESRNGDYSGYYYRLYSVDADGKHNKRICTVADYVRKCESIKQAFRVKNNTFICLIKGRQEAAARLRLIDTETGEVKRDVVTLPDAWNDEWNLKPSDDIPNHSYFIKTEDDRICLKKFAPDEDEPEDENEKFDGTMIIDYNGNVISADAEVEFNKQDSMRL